MLSNGVCSVSRPLSGDVVIGIALMMQRSSESKAAQRRPWNPPQRSGLTWFDVRELPGRSAR
jgi:hypothetical protein